MMKDLSNPHDNPSVEIKVKYRIILTVTLLVAGVLATLAWGSPTAQALAGGSVGGVVYWIDQYGNARLMPWAQITASDGVSQVTTYTTDGSYAMWLLPGTYDITASSSPGFAPDVKSGIVVSQGSSVSLDFQLNQTGVPIAEIPAWSQPLVVLFTLAITAVAVRRYKTHAKT
jgi:hypothetical protein